MIPHCQLTREAERLQRDLLTPLERFNDQFAQLDRLRSTELIDDSLFDRAIAKIVRETDGPVTITRDLSELAAMARDENPHDDNVRALATVLDQEIAALRARGVLTDQDEALLTEANEALSRAEQVANGTRAAAFCLIR